MKINKIVKRYKYFVLNVENLTFADTGLVGLIGDNGAGKSTLLKIMAGITPANVFEVDMMGNCTQTKILMSKCSFRIDAEEKFNGKLKNIINDFCVLYKDFNSDACRKMLSKLNINEKLKYSKLSQGMKAQFKLSIILHLPVKILYLDEITNGLDMAIRQVMYNGIKEASRDKLVLFSTHILDQDSGYYDRVLLIDSGRIVYDTGMSDIDDAELLDAYKNRCKAKAEVFANG